MATLVVRYPDGRTEEHSLEGKLSVGRADGNDLVLAEGGVSRRHAQFTAAGAEVYVEDAGSSNGTWLDGERVTGRVKIPPRGVVKIGDYEVVVGGGAAGRAPVSSGRPGPRPPGSSEATGVRPTVAPRATKVVPAVKRPVAAPGGKAGGAAPPSRPAPGGRAAGAEAGPHLRGVNGPWTNKVFPVRGKVAVGRVPQANVFLDDESVSRRHAEVARVGNTYTVTDLGSANGTHLNGEPLPPNEPAPLHSGDSVQFGVVELVFDVGEQAALAPLGAARGGKSLGPAGGGRAPAKRGGAAGGLDGRKKKLVIAGGAVATLLLVGVVIKASSGGDDPPGPPTPRPGTGAGAGGGEDPAALDLNALLSECRTHSALDGVVEPNWARAEKACAKVLEQEPIHAEALALAKRIRIEKDASEIYRMAEKELRLGREEDALVRFGTLPADSGYYRKARPRVRETINKLKKPLGDDCMGKVRDRAMASALSRCELFMQFTCCDLGEEFLTPPPGSKVVLDGGGRNAWRPDPAVYEGKVYTAYMRAKLHDRPSESPVYACSGSRIFCSYEQKLADPRQEIMEYARRRYPEKTFQEALVSYWKGNAGDAVVRLQKLRETRDKALLHADADALRKDIENVANLYKTGGTALQKLNVQDADLVFTEALELDQRIMQEMTLKRPSSFRVNIQKDMALAAMQAGRVLANQRQDERRACQLFRLGMKYSTSELDLLTMAGRCSERSGILQKTADCEQLGLAEAIAMDGDGNKEKIAARKAELGCR